MRAVLLGERTWVLVSESGVCQPLKYLRKHRETAPVVMERINRVDRSGPLENPELFRWLDSHRHRGYRLCEYKIHHPRACRVYAFRSLAGFVVVRIENKTTSETAFNDTMSVVKASIDRFITEGERYDGYS